MKQMRISLLVLLFVLAACGRSSEQAQNPTRPPASVIATAQGGSPTVSPPVTVVVPTLVPTNAPQPTNAPTDVPPPTDVPAPPTPSPSATAIPPTVTPEPPTPEPPTPTAEPTMTPVPPTATVVPPTATVVPPTATSEPTPPSIDPLPGDFEVIAWEGLRVPVPMGYTTGGIATPGENVNGAPLLARLAITPRGTNSSNGKVPPIVLTIVRFTGELDAWLDAVRNAPDGQAAIDDDTVRSVQVAGLPGRSYEPEDQDNGQPITHIAKLGPDRLLLITSDQTFREQQSAVAEITVDVDGNPTPTPGNSASLTGEIAYLNDRNLWLLELPGGKPRQLTKDGDINAFAWSPDGQEIAIAAGDESNDIWTVAPRNGKRTRVTKGDANEMFPAYTPDGTLFYVRRNLESETPLIEIVRHGGNKKDTVVHSEPGGLVGPTGLQFHSDTEFILTVSTGRGSYVLLGDLDTGQTQDLAETYLPNGTGCAYQAAWSGQPARLVALTSFDCIPHENSTIMQLDLDGSKAATKVLFTGAQINSVTWTPDDSALVFATTASDGMAAGIWLLDLRGTPSEPQPLAKGGVSPAWRPAHLDAE